VIVYLTGLWHKLIFAQRGWQKHNGTMKR